MSEPGATRRAPRLMLVTDSARSRLPLETLVPAAVRGGVDLVHVREPLLSDGELVRLVERLRGALEDAASRAGTSRRARLVVNERFDVALAAGADGVHLKSNGLEPRAVIAALARLAPADLLVGLSVHRPDEMAAAAAAGVSYCCVSPLHDAGPGKTPLGAPGLAALLEGARASGPLPPFVVLGGVTPADAGDVARCAGAGESWGLAALRPFAAAETPEAAEDAAARYRAALDAAERDVAAAPGRQVPPDPASRK